MAQLIAAWMSQEDTVKDGLRRQLFGLQSLLSYLEDRGQLGAKEYLYCQATLRETVKELKQLERATGHHRDHA